MNKQEPFHWQYLGGYLHFLERGDYWKAQVDDNPLLKSKLLFILCPRNCVCEDRVPGSKEYKRLGEVEYQVGGVPRRYALTAQNFDDDGWYLVEYASPLRTLGLMHDNEATTGMTLEDMERQYDAFVTALTDMISNSPYLSQRVKIITYAGSPKSVKNLLESNI